MSWWRQGVIYQVYPRSFRDLDGDGVGDLPGITEKLDYLAGLGVDALWISPIFPSPMADFGYDVADYCGVDPLFGSLEDMDRLIEAAHARGLKVLLDLVPNHTSDQHPWFLEARSSRENPKRGWYLWADPAPDGGPPNNWLSFFGGPAWTLDPSTGQYYLHQFLREQPELDHRNPEVREAIHEAMRFWFRRGVDGFRVDVIWLMIKDPELRDEPPNPAYRPGAEPPHRSLLHTGTADQPEVHGVIRGLRAVCDEFPERVMIGEIYLPLEELVEYYGAALDECHLPFNFHLLEHRDWSAAGVRTLVERYEACLPEGAWPNWVLGNHDQPRVASRLGPERARLAQLLLLTLRGTPTLYYGDELGMVDVEVPREAQRDPQGLRDSSFVGACRDAERTPMRWSSRGACAGFCPEGATPWLPMGEDLERVNVESQDADPRSFLSFCRALLCVRRASPALRAGSYRSLEVPDPDLLVFERRCPEQRVLVVLNFAGETRALDLSSLAGSLELLVSSSLAAPGPVDPAAIRVGPYGGGVLEVAS